MGRRLPPSGRTRPPGTRKGRGSTIWWAASTASGRMRSHSPPGGTIVPAWRRPGRVRPHGGRIEPGRIPWDGRYVARRGVLLAVSYPASPTAWTVAALLPVARPPDARTRCELGVARGHGLDLSVSTGIHWSVPSSRATSGLSRPLRVAARRSLRASAPAPLDELAGAAHARRDSCAILPEEIAEPCRGRRASSPPATRSVTVLFVDVVGSFRERRGRGASCGLDRRAASG